MTDAEIEQAIRDMFEENYTLLQAEGGHSLMQDVKHAALQQVLLYWRKMRKVAENITETEVKLSLPERVTPKGRKFAIEGVVDIIREDDRTVMYDIKTHDADYVRANKDFYEKQLNIYAYIWQHLRQQPLDETAIIATSYPDFVKEALEDPQQLDAALEQWNPLIDIPLNPQHVEETIRDFAEVVDKIEGNEFAPPRVDKLHTLIQGGGRQRSFATQVCRNCDARYSCLSYRRYAISSGGRPEPKLAHYFQDCETDLDQEVWLNANLREELLPGQIAPREQPHETRGAFFVVPYNPNLNNAKHILLKCRSKFETLLLNGKLNGRSLYPETRPLGTWKGRPYFNLISTTRQGDIWPFFDPPSNSLMYAGGTSQQDFSDLASYAQQKRPSYNLPPKPVSIQRFDDRYWCATLLDAQEQAQVNAKTIVDFYKEVILYYTNSH